MYEFPIWQQGRDPQFLALEGDLKADVAIVGGGLTGVTCALMLASQGVHAVVLEADRLGGGATWGCTGKVTAHQPDTFQTIQRCAGKEAATVYARLLQQCLTGVWNMVGRMGIPCGAELHDVYLYAHKPNQVTALEHLTRAEEQAGLTLTRSDDAACPFPVAASSVMAAQPMVMPMPYLMGMARATEQFGGHLFERTRVTAIEGHNVVTERGTVQAERVILATGSPMGMRRLPVLSMMEQHMLELRVLEGPALTASQLDVLPDGMYLRPIPQGVVISYDLGLVGDNHGPRCRKLEGILRQLLPEYKTVQRFFRQDVWSLDGLPLIGPTDPKDGAVLMASAYNGWGMTGSFLAGRLLTSEILDKPMAEAPLFYPDRVYPGHTWQQLRGAMHPAGAYLKSVAHLASPTCPHMACKMVYSRETQRWECPCHGSCFSSEGHVFHTPAMNRARVPMRKQ